MLGLIYFIAFSATVPVANWFMFNVGQCHDAGPCLVPVGFGLMAPSGVFVIGAAMVLRDLLQQEMGKRWAIAAIATGAVLSAWFSPPELVVASVLAFAVAEVADMAVYTPIKKKSLALAIMASGTVGAAVDSAIFLLVAFGSLEFVAGQVVGKIWASAATAALAAFKETTND